MESTELQGLEQGKVGKTLVAKNPEQQAGKDETAKDTTRKSLKLALIPLRSAAVSKIVNPPQKPLEVKKFPIVLGRTNLSQWWYESCDCQQYYCRLHCRPVAKNIGSLSKVMIQIDTQGNAHIVGKNPHLVTITSSQAKGNATNATNNTHEEGESSSKAECINVNKEQNHQKPIVLRLGDILSIGRRDREPWMRFQVVNADHLPSLPTVKKNNGTNTKQNEQKKSNETAKRATTQTQQQAQTSTRIEKAKFSPPASPQKSSRHDAELPEWITTTNNNSNSGKRRSTSYHNTAIYGSTTDTKEQLHHQAMVATLTKAAAAAGAAADADERNKSKKHDRYNSYYNYYNQSNSNSNYEAAAPSATADVSQQRRKRRHTSSSFAPFHQTSNSNHHKSLIRSAEDLFYNGSSRRGGRLHHMNDPQIHLVFQDYETSAQLIRAGTMQGRKRSKPFKASNGNINAIDTESPPAKRRKRARTDRNFIGKPHEEETNDSAIAPAQPQQSKSMGLLSKNYAAALLGVSTPSLEAPADLDEKEMDASLHLVVLPEDQPEDRS